MSAFAQHDEMHPIVDGDPCRYCDELAPMFLEGTQLVAIYQVAREGDDPLVLCRTCWEIAERGALNPEDDIEIVNCVHTLHAPVGGGV